MYLYAVIRNSVVYLRTSTCQTVGPTNVRRSILKKSGKRSPRVHLELKHKKTAERFINIREQLGPISGNYPGWGALSPLKPNAPTFAGRDPNNTLWAEEMVHEKQLGSGPKQLYRIRGTYLENEATFFSPKDGVGSSSCLERQSRRKRIYCGFLCLYAYDEHVELTPRRIGKLSKCLDSPPL